MNPAQFETSVNVHPILGVEVDAEILAPPRPWMDH